MNYKRALFPIVFITAISAAIVACADDTPVDSGFGDPDAGQSDKHDGGARDSSQPDENDAQADAKDAANPKDAAASDASDASDDADAALPACTSPITFTPAADAKDKATAALAALSATATMDWSDVSGSIASVSWNGATNHLATPACTGTEDLYQKFADFLEASPDLFQFDRTEWQLGTFSCADVPQATDDTPFKPVTLYRRKLGPYAYQGGTISTVVRRDGGVPYFGNINTIGTDLPSGSVALGGLQCQLLTAAELEAKVRAKAFAYETLDECQVVDTFQYTVAASDSVTFDDGELLVDEAAGIKFNFKRTATVIVAPANFTADLTGSNANCPDDEGHTQVGWMRTLDSVTGEVLEDQTGPRMFCGICF